MSHNSDFFHREHNILDLLSVGKAQRRIISMCFYFLYKLGFLRCGSVKTVQFHSKLFISVFSYSLLRARDLFSKIYIYIYFK